MKTINSILSMLAAATIKAAVPLDETENSLLSRQSSSGCYAFEDPGCCINYAVCQCANGWFYQYNQDQNGCDPPWGFLTSKGVGDLPGNCC
ncbi:hypothetical protein M426DRAFT_15558 [Hypoxylon sp. CI-4A]|nr:hypothetical protein M426DRAFT_15558 [Hypoxylon sp. CI-4A]